MNNQAKVIFASFIYFSLVMEKNDYKVSNELRRLYRKLSNLTRMYENMLDTVVSDMNRILKDIDKDVDYMLLSVTILAEYYEQLKGKRKEFNPMSHKQILMLQDECLEEDCTTANDTFEVAEIIVRGLLNDRK